jgi:MFS family permease
MLLLALLLFVRSTSGSFVTAGAVSAAFAIGVAGMSPVLGRLVDVRGQTRVLLFTGLLHPVALVAVLVTATRSAPPAVVLVLAGLAGGFLPPLSACMRALWPELLSDADQRETAFGLEAVVIEVCELGGPLLVGGLTAVVSPAAAVLVSGLLTGLGTLLFALAPASRRWVHGSWHTRRWRGPLGEPGVRWLLLVIAFSTAGLAAFEVAIAAFATGQGSSASAGTLLALWIASSVAGGWFYGARRWGAPLPVQLVMLLALVTAGTLAPLFATGTWTMAALLVVAGIGNAPAIAVQLGLMASVAPERSRTEAFTWASTANFLGIAAGSAVAGMLVQRGGFRWGIVAAAGLAAVTGLLALVGRHGLGLPRADDTSAEDAYDLAIFELLASERDEALAEAARADERSAELARDVAELRSRLDELAQSAGTPGGQPAPGSSGDARRALARLDSSLADLYLLEHRREAVLRDIEELRAELQAGTLPANVTALPRQSSQA